MTLKEQVFQTMPQGKMLILGWGREGQSTRNFLASIWPEQTLWVADQKPVTLSDEKTQFYSKYLQDLSQFAVIWKSPGISQDLPELQQYVKQGGILTTQLNQVLSVYRSKMIGVTGTKGKSTTSTLITEVLQAAGKSVVLAGNIGLPLFDIADQFEQSEWIVAEMSSYMLDAATESPHIAVFLNLFNEHLNYHGSREKYALAKANITKFQTATDWLVVNVADQIGKELLSQTAAQIMEFQPDLSAQAVGNLSLVATQHNWPAVLAVAKILEVPEEVTLKVADTFSGLPHRLQKVATINDVTFYDDTLATVPEAAVAALNAVPNTSVILLGGYDRGIEYDFIVDTVVAKKIPFVFLFPPSGEKMAGLFSRYPEAERPKYALVQTMEEAVISAFKVAKPGTAILLSPASPSFGQFQDYEQKSAAFKEAIAKLPST